MTADILDGERAALYHELPPADVGNFFLNQHLDVMIVVFEQEDVHKRFIGDELLNGFIRLLQIVLDHLLEIMHIAHLRFAVIRICKQAQSLLRIFRLCHLHQLLLCQQLIFHRAHACDGERVNLVFSHALPPP